jgi:iron complex outermembrane receptor protein
MRPERDRAQVTRSMGIETTNSTKNRKNRLGISYEEEKMPTPGRNLLSRHLKAVAVLLLIGWYCGSPPSHCDAEEDHSSQELKLETITVTAQKREEDVQKVPTSITVLSDVEIEDAQIESTKDIWRYVPNLITSYEGARDYFSRIKVRGISNTGFGDPGVALYIDDVSYAGVYAFDSSLFDIERIEVLKGPQGTLYGKSTEGGTINIITKAPDNNFGGKVGVEGGDYDKRRIDGLINAPLVKDRLFFRLAALKSSRDGYIKNVFNGKDVDNHDTTAANASLFFTPTDDLTFDVKYRIQKYDDDGGYPMAPMDKRAYRAGTGLSNLDDFEIACNYIGESSSKSEAASLRIRYEWDKIRLVSVTAYRDMDNSGSLDPDFTPLEMYFGRQAVKSESITQEFRLQSKETDESFNWLFGLYYGHEEKDYDSNVKYDRIYADMMGVPLYTEEITSATIGAEDMAVFGQSTVRFFNDALGLTGGLRYERSKRTMDRQHTFAGVPVVASMKGLEETNSQFLPKLSVDYRIRNNIMTYAGVARGYKAGGFAYAVDDPELTAFDPEESTAFELGLKTEFPEHGLRVNLAGFYTRVDDYQDRVQIDAMTVFQANVTETDIFGFELEAAYALTDSLSLSGFIGYTNAEYGEYIDPMTLENYEGNRVANIPEYNSGLFLEYRDEFGIFGRAEIQNIGSNYFDRANTQKQSSYFLYNMKVGYEQERWDIYLTAKNLTDEQYFLEACEYQDIGWVGTVGDPRTISLRFSYRF